MTLTTTNRRSRSLGRTTGLAIAAALLAAAPFLTAQAQQQHAHVHGQLKLDVAVDGPTVVIDMESPLDNIVGFERAPKTDAEKKPSRKQLRSCARPTSSSSSIRPPTASSARSTCAPAHWAWATPIERARRPCRPRRHLLLQLHQRGRREVHRPEPVQRVQGPAPDRLADCHGARPVQAPAQTPGRRAASQPARLSWGK